MIGMFCCAAPLRRLAQAPSCASWVTTGGTRWLNGASSPECTEAQPRKINERRLPARPTTVTAPNMMDIGVRSIFNEDHDIFRKSARKFFSEEVLPHHRQWEKDGCISRECWLGAGELGLLGTDTPAEQGGVGGDFKDAAIVLEEQSYVNCTGPGFSLHSQIVMPYISHYGSPEQIQKFIPDMTAGRKIGAIAMTEPNAGSDLQGIQTYARRDGDDWILNGSKIYISNGIMCDVVIVAAVTDPSAKSKAHGISLFLVENGMPGFKKGRNLDKMGLKAQDTAELFFEDVRLPPSALLGKLNNGFYYLMNELPQERLTVGVFVCASCEWQVEETREYLRNRKAFGKTLSNLQTIRHEMAALKTEVCVGRAFTDQCIEEHVMGRLSGEGASMCKYWLSDLQNRVAASCVQLFGGCGYMSEYPISRAYLDARVQTIYGGANEIMKELIARSIFR